ncbi:ribonuclease P protein component [Planobispora longispora]|uniref:Ribonuclease P protein component n=1 Tax=Planobispora longispora TaxID=28887 RepID=A0A8J3W3E7_9ACTN|nr:ribonuclease P protein component [Planobispora longispora]BFE84991.1 ribonuclease P protein component [Planobispora longispora]GIH75304.1 ribonuclease P protein component [Planobispora longispora]
MLPSGSRMRRGEDFADAVRKGGRAGRPTLVAHLRVPAEPAVTDDPPLVGFVVSRAVGGAVIRNQVKRRLRHLMRERLDRLPRGSLLVVRANPPAASARSERLAAELDVALDRLLRRRESPKTRMDGRR